MFTPIYELQYDKDFPKVAEGNFHDGVLIFSLYKKRGYEILYYQTSDTQKTGILCNLRLRVSELATTGDYELKIRVTDCINDKYESVPASAENGTIGIIGQLSMVCSSVAGGCDIANMYENASLIIAYYSQSGQQLKATVIKAVNGKNAIPEKPDNTDKVRIFLADSNMIPLLSVVVIR